MGSDPLLPVAAGARTHCAGALILVGAGSAPLTFESAVPRWVSPLRGQTLYCGVSCSKVGSVPIRGQTLYCGVSCSKVGQSPFGDRPLTAESAVPRWVSPHSGTDPLLL